VPAERRQEAFRRKNRVFIIDDHPIVREGLAQLINRQTDLMVCGEAEDAHTAVRVIGNVKPDIVIVDISLKGSDGIEFLKNLKTKNPAIPVLVLSIHDESLYAPRALRAGARGYIMKQEGTEKVLIALRRVLSGDVYVSDRMAKRMLEQFVSGRQVLERTPVHCLSDRELAVFRLIGQGYGTRDIAKELYLSVKTVESYREHIKDKMELRNAAELIQHAVKWVESEKSN
jgi:DNA-binding NarL/FixJ family response regulator